MIDAQITQPRNEITPLSRCESQCNRGAKGLGGRHGRRDVSLLVEEQDNVIVAIKRQQLFVAVDMYVSWKGAQSGEK